MPLVDIKEAEKKALEAKEAIPEIISKIVGDQTYFSGKVLKDQWFTDYGECVRANEKEAHLKAMKALGLNEYGQSPEDEKRSQQKRELIKKKNDLLKKVAEVDLELARVIQGVKTDESTEPKKKK